MKSRVVTLKQEIERIIVSCEVCNIAMIDLNNEPYVIPMNFGYESGVIYFHSSQTGKKIDILKKNPKVSVSFSTGHELRWQSENVACSYSMKYKSVLAFGKVGFVEDFDKKREALDIIMKNYTERDFKYSDPSIWEVMVFKVVVDKFEGRIRNMVSPTGKIIYLNTVARSLKSFCLFTN